MYTVTKAVDFFKVIYKVPTVIINHRVIMEVIWDS